MIALGLAFLAGLATVAAPCTLPMLPIVLGASVGATSRTRPAMIALGFITAFAAVALVLGALARAVSFDPAVVRTAASVLLAAFGALMIWQHGYEMLTLRLSGLVDRGAGLAAGRDWNALGGFAFGATLGLVWTPCAGPVLGSILTVIATAGSWNWSGVLLLAYGIGAALPMLAIAYGGQLVSTRVRRVARIAPRLQQGFGVVVIAFAAATYLQYDTDLVAWLTTFYPSDHIGL
ncbi:MAG: cytochrome c biogenesis CcdA family protein [Xanthobacteraceae bacterium]|nr:cytochrome c biogenesis CcdA family protein [Xanthobacteraceae bacterium]